MNLILQYLTYKIPEPDIMSCEIWEDWTGLFLFKICNIPYVLFFYKVIINYSVLMYFWPREQKIIDRLGRPYL